MNCLQHFFYPDGCGGPTIPAVLKPWLYLGGSLTQQLRRHCLEKFTVHLQHQHWQPTLLYEQHALGLKKREQAFIRTVYLHCGLQPWVFARTVIPALTFRQRRWAFLQLDQQPLGELLFRDPAIQRTHLTVAAITATHPLYPALLQEPLWPLLWGRVSQFQINQQPLLVQEIFLPAFMQTLLPCGAAPASARQ